MFLVQRGPTDHPLYRNLYCNLLAVITPPAWSSLVGPEDLLLHFTIILPGDVQSRDEGSSHPATLAWMGSRRLAVLPFSHWEEVKAWQSILLTVPVNGPTKAA